MRRDNRLRTFISCLVIVFLLFLISCTTDYVTGKRTFSLVSESQEIAMGKEADPHIVGEYGLYEDPELAAYIDNLGQSLARVSQRPHLTYTFRVLDTPVVNAFALPGGYVYITRGILAHFNSEDELAGVIGHEIGHVVARHSAEQMSRTQIATLGLGVGSIISETVAQYAQYAQAGLGLLFLKFSREQESESDMLGVEYSTKIGYDSHHMAGFFKTLKSMSDDGGQGLPSFMSTHPDPGDRELDVHQLTNEWQQKVAYQPLNTERYSYLKRIDGIVFGDDPRQGFVENQVFYHPNMRFKFPVPKGWRCVNTASTVMMLDREEKAMVQLTLGKTSDPEQEANEFIQKQKATVTRRVQQSVHGFSASVVGSTVQNENNTLQVLSYFIKKDDKVYILHGFTIPGIYDIYEKSFKQVMEGFSEVTDKAVLEKKPVRLRLRKAPRSGDVATVLSALGVEQKRLKEMALVNGKKLSERVEKGEWMKIAVE